VGTKKNIERAVFSLPSCFSDQYEKQLMGQERVLTFALLPPATRSQQTTATAQWGEITTQHDECLLC